jgi:hypothetical protein
MRIRVSGRIIALGCLVALLCVLPTPTPVAHARPIGPNPWGDSGDPPPLGDTDGVVLSKSFVRGTTVATAAETGTTTAVRSRHGLWSSVLTVYRHGGLRGILAGLRLPGWWLGLR